MKRKETIVVECEWLLYMLYWKNTFKFRLKLLSLKLIKIQNVAITLNFGCFFMHLAFYLIEII